MQTASQIADLVRRGETTAERLCDEALTRLKARDGGIHAFLHVDPDRALARARDVDRRRARGEAGPLCGVPIAVKDNLCTRGAPTTVGSRILQGYLPPYDATVVERLERAGAVVVGKTNCDEFAMGSSTEHSAFGATRNPHDRSRVPGGSSGGSAAAVAAGIVPLSVGSDTGGSIRQPASLCGIVGLKPTYGRVSRYGLVAFASSLDQVGPMSADVRGAALALGVMAGADPRDSTAAERHVPDYSAALTGDVRGLRVGVPRALLGDGVDADVLYAFEEALRVIASRGARVEDIALPHAAYGIPVYYLVATAEASSNLARYDGVRYGYRAESRAGEGPIDLYERTREEGFGAEVKRRIILGTYVLSAGYYDAYYVKAQQVRTLIRRDYESAFQRLEVIALPTTPTPAFEIGERTADPLQMYLADVFTVGVNLAGLPGISVPCGASASGLPIGLQLVGRAFEEETILRAADAYQRDAGTFHFANAS
jgi:aspartyl-tRNA(Asn)/glutamyl-tRNA(Gln) amidotransferase subunit A